MPLNTPSALSVRDLSHTFPNGNGGLDVLTDLSFDVAPEEFLCILGPSGSGKTTLLRVLSGLLTATGGTVSFQGTPLIEPSSAVGVVFQNANLMPWRTVLGNITLPLEVLGTSAEDAKQQAQELIALVGLEGFEDSYPRDLSGGMAHRVAIARALIHDPQVLLLDEPFSSLDAFTREKMGEELLRIWEAHRKTVVMVTHSISEAVFLADRVLVLSQRPARICLDLTVPLPRPRHLDLRYTPTFGTLARQIRSAMS